MKRKDPQDAPARRMGSRERILLILTDTATFTVKPLFTMENFQSIMQPIYLQALGRSVLITVSTVIGCILLGFPLAYFISQSPKKLQMALLLAVMVPFWTSFVVRTYAWLTLLAPSGAVTQFLSLVGIVSPDADLRYTQTAITIGMIYTYLPMMVLPLFATLEKLDPNLLAASADLGGSSVRTFFSVVVPQARSGIAAGCLLVAIPALGEYTIPAILGGGKTLMIGNVIASEFTTTGDYSRGAALAAILMIAVLLVVVGMQIAARKKGSRR